MASSQKSSDTDSDAAAAAAKSASTLSLKRSSWRNGFGFFQQKAHYYQLAIGLERRQHEAALQLVKEQAAQEIARLRQEAAQEKESFQRDTQALQAKVNAQEAQLHEARLLSFANLARGPYRDEDDSKIMDDVRILHHKLWMWARANCLPDMDAVRQAINEAPTHFAQRFAKAGVNDGRLLDSARPVSLKRLPALILAALVAENIYAAMFFTPFFFLNHVCPYPQRDRHEGLCHTLALIHKCTSPPSNSWCPDSA